MIQGLNSKGYKNLYVDGGKVIQSFLKEDLIDEMIIYVAPVLMGNNARGLFALPGLDSMQDKIELDIIEQRMVGQDMRLTVKVRQVN